MKVTTTIICTLGIAALIVFGCRESVPVVKPGTSLEAKYQELVELNRKKNERIMVLEIEVQKLKDLPVPTVDNTERDDLRKQVSQLTAEPLKARQPASSQNCTSLATEPSQHAQAAVPSAVPVYERRGILRGRWRR